MAKRKDVYVATMRLVRDRGVLDEELVRALSDWKRLKDGGANPPKWSRETPDTLEGFLRLLFTSENAKPGTPHSFGLSVRGDRINVCAIFTAEAGRTPLIAQALSFMAFGLRPGTYLDISRSRSNGVSHRRFEIVRNGDGEPEVEEVKADG